MTRIDPNRPTETHEPTTAEPAKPEAAKEKAKAAAPAHKKDPGVEQIKQQLKSKQAAFKMPSLSTGTFIKESKPEPAPAKNGPLGDTKAAIEEKLAPALRKAERENPFPSYLETTRPQQRKIIVADARPSAPPHIRAEAARRLDVLDVKHRALCATFEKGIRGWEKRATDLEKLTAENHKKGIFSDDLSQSVWHAKRQADACRDHLRTLKNEFAEATQEYRVLIGESNQAAVKNGGIIPGAERPLLPLERLQAKIDKYNKSVDTLKSSGVLVQPVAVAIPVAALVNGRSIDASDRKAMDNVYQLGSVLEMPLAVRDARTSGLSGAASPAPGVDYRVRHEK
jgi:hypothetical protein